MDGTLLLLKIFLFPLTLLAIAFLEGSETVLTSLSGLSLSQLKNKHPKVKFLFEFWENNPDKMLASIVLANTLATVFSGTLATSIGLDLSEMFFWSRKWVIPLLTFLTTVVVLLFCEIVPKVLGRLQAETFARFVLMPLVPLTKITHPIVTLLASIGSFFVKLFGTEPQKEIPDLRLREFQGMLGRTEEQSPSSPHRILSNLLEFGQLRVQDIQKNRENVFAIDLGTNTKEVIRLVTESGYSRIPVYRETLDNIEGIIYAKDLLSAWRTEGLILIPDLLRPVYFVSEETQVMELLREFKQGRHHFAIVRDQQKKITGIITIEDLIEELVGGVYDESKIQ